MPRRVLDQLLPPGSATSPTAPKSKQKTETMTREVSEKLRAHVKITDGNVVPKVVAQTANAISSGSNLVSRVLEIIAEEIGLAASELTPNSAFADLGVDSLLSLTITSRLREEVELDVSSLLFAEYLTVQELTVFLRRDEDTTASSSQPTSGDRTPGTSSESSGYQTDQTSPSSEEDLGDIDVMATMRCILAEEIGISAHELKGSSDFGELGLDSLLSLTVLARLREELDLDLPGSLFLERQSLDEVEAFLGLKREPAVMVKEINPSSNSSVSSSTTKISLSEAADYQSVPIAGAKKEMISPAVDIQVSQSLGVSSIPKASSMLLQGNAKVATKCLFLFPDGSGSATSYAPLPPISSDVVVYGLNCPYMRTPQEMKCSLEELTPPYIAEIRRRQPHGPYYLGGWSAGGICAFDAAQEFERCGEKVSRLILIDSPFPIGLEKLPSRLYDFFTSIGMFGSGGAKAPPSWLIPHFLAFVDALDRYRATAFSPGRGPERTCIVWAKDGVCKHESDPRPEPRDDDPREMKWLLNNRTDFGPNGWDGLLGDGEVRIETIEGANHFTLMEGGGHEGAGGKVRELRGFLERAML